MAIQSYNAPKGKKKICQFMKDFHPGFDISILFCSEEMLNGKVKQVPLFSDKMKRLGNFLNFLFTILCSALPQKGLIV